MYIYLYLTLSLSFSFGYFSWLFFLSFFCDSVQFIDNNFIDLFLFITLATVNLFYEFNLIFFICGRTNLFNVYISNYLAAYNILYPNFNNFNSKCCTQMNTNEPDFSACGLSYVTTVNEPLSQLPIDT